MTQKISILGAGESGTGSALLAKSKGFSVFVSDQGSIAPKYKEVLTEYGIDFEEGKHSEEIILTSDVVIKSPGIPDKAPLVKKLVAKGIPVISEIEFASKYTHAKLVAITGSNGKTTTTLFTYHLLKEMGLHVGLAGNIGKSFAWQVWSEDMDYYVLELSSFQLDGTYSLKPFVSILLNITPDHLDRYEYKFENYIASKFRIAQNADASTFLIVSEDDPVLAKEMPTRLLDTNILGISLKNEKANGAFADDQYIYLQNSTGVKLPIDQLPLKGKHNLTNMMAGFTAAAALGLDARQFVEKASTFKNAAHRLEFVREFQNVTYINDSKATNVDSVYYALDAIPKNIVWIAGGVDKGNDYTAIEGLVKERVKALVCLGKDNSKLHEFFGKKVEKMVDASSMKEAIDQSKQLATSGDVVLLSPACASFDLFNNYEDRGDQFKTLVAELK
ncbi:MAG: UDP-N-acetylmuramoylalanine--D-glutamate ligase [Chitinophagaceae bacterium]|nr:UDP-N-acetylmuramoylalanine--D-glutamate ligase [Chitinophagaceae bacterium]